MSLEQALAELHKDMAEALHILRHNGWVVAVHNDYRQGGKSYTFWLFTNGNQCVRGEGTTDGEALAVVFSEIGRLKKTTGADCEEVARDKGIKDAAEWISSAMASSMFGSDSFYLRKRMAEVIKSRDWEHHLKNEEMRG